MPLEVFTNADNVSVTGPITISKDPVTGVDGNLTVNGTSGLTTTQLNVAVGTATAQAIVTGNTVTIPAGQTVVRLTAAGAATGVILPLGSRNGQILILEITTAAANTIAMAAAGTSNCAGGTTYVLAGLEAHMFVWDATAALWFIIGPAAN